MREVELVNAIEKEIIIIDDCSIDGTPDMEYDPYAYNELIKPVLRGNADVVYGSRFRGGNPGSKFFTRHSAGNNLQTVKSSVETNLNLTDMESRY